MKTVHQIEEILDVFGDMGVLVVRRIDHEILYANKAIKDLGPQWQEGMVCSGMWQKGCEDCPVNRIGEKEYDKVVAYSYPLQKVVDLSATKILWQGMTPAFLVTISPHVETEEEKEVELARTWLVGALPQVYKMTAVVNLTRDETLILYGEDWLRLTKRGSLRELFHAVGTMLTAEEKRIYGALFAKENLMKRFYEGEKKVEQEIFLQEVGWISCGCFFLENSYNQEILSVILIKDINEQKKIEEEQRKQLEFTYTSMQGASGTYCITENDVYLMDASHAYFELLYGSLEEYRGNGNRVLPWMEDWERKRYLQSVLESARKREPFLVEFPRIQGDGTVNWIQTQGIVIGEQEGYPVYYGVLQDISEKKRLELERETTFNSLPGGVAKILLDERLTIRETNETFWEMFGKGSGLGFLSSVYSIDKKTLQKEVKRLRQSHGHCKVELRMLGADDEIIWIHMEGNEISRENGIPIYLFVMMDVTNYVEIRMQLEEVQEKYHKSIAESNSNILEYDSVNKCFLVANEELPNEYYTSISFRYLVEEDEIVFSEAIKAQLGMQLYYKHFKRALKKENVIFEGDCEILKSLYAQCNLDDVAAKAQLRLLTTEGAYEWFELYCKPIWNKENKRCEKITGTLLNINALRQVQSEATTWREKARKDPLTSVYNRAIFREKVTKLLEEGKTGALLFIDVDNFKNINDTLGHALGDDILVTVANRLRSSFRETEDVIGRYGGDEFVVFLRNMPSYEALEHKLTNLMETFREQYVRGDKTWQITGSVGAALYPQDAQDYQTLLERADIALYASKNNGKDQFTLYADCVKQ